MSPETAALIAESQNARKEYLAWVEQLHAIVARSRRIIAEQHTAAVVAEQLHVRRLDAICREIERRRRNEAA